jgi:internalin A
LTEKELFRIIRRAKEFEWKTLDLSGEELESLPDEIGSLITLTQLILDNNSLESIPDAVGNLVNLNHLSLNNNHLNSLPDSIGNLIYLTHLSAEKNYLASLPHSIGSLGNLARLSLNENHLESLPDSIGKLTGLIHLGLDNNLLLSLPESIGFLTDLNHLNLYSNRLTSLPDNIGRMVSLTTLSVGRNQLTALPDSIETRTGLSGLYLSGNRLKSLPENIGRLVNLITLDLDDNNLASLPESIGKLKKLRGFRLSNNPLDGLSPDVVAEGGDAILEYYRGLRMARASRYEGRLIIVGDEGVGKTCLAGALCGESFRKRQPTCGVEIRRRTEKHPENPEEVLSINIWDFSGRESSRPFLQRFFTRRALYLLVFNARVETDPERLFSWLDVIRSRAPKAPVLLVATQCRDHCPKLDFERFREQYKNIIAGDDFYHVDVDAKMGIERLNSDISKYSWNLEIMGRKWPRSFADTVKEIERRVAKGETCIERNKLYQIMGNAGLDGLRNREMLTRILASIGKVIHFPNSFDLGDLIIINLQWLIRGLSLVFDREELPAENGRLNHQRLTEIWLKDYPGQQDLLVRCLAELELCFPVMDDPGVILVPLHLPAAKPEKIEWIRQPGSITRRLTYRFRCIPPDIMPRFMARTRRMATGVLWKNGVFLRKGQAEGLCELRPEKHEMVIEVRSVYPLNLLERLGEYLENILEKYEGLKYRKLLGAVGEVTVLAPGSPGNTGEKREDAAPGWSDGNLNDSDKNQVDALDLVCGLKEFTTHWDVLKSIEENVGRALEEMHPVKDSVIATGKKLIEMFEHQQRVFMDWMWCLDKEIFGQLPTLLTIMPTSSRRVKPAHWADRIYQLSLCCQAEDGIHPVGKTYEFKRSMEWWQRIYPYLIHLQPILRVVGGPAGQMLPSYLPGGLWRRAKGEFEVMKGWLDEIDLPTFDLQKSETARQDDLLEPDDIAIKAISSLIGEVDKRDSWNNCLTRVAMPGGKILWLCDTHLRKYLSCEAGSENKAQKKPDKTEVLSGLAVSPKS